MTSELVLNLWSSLGAVPSAELAQPECREVYEQNRHRLYSLAFWMTGNELRAEVLLERAFCRAFKISGSPSAEALDGAMIRELERLHSLRNLTLNCAPVCAVLSVRKSAKRTDLEDAVVRLPACERMIFLLHDVEGYSGKTIARLIGLDEALVSEGLHQARLRLRELLAACSEFARAA